MSAASKPMIKLGRTPFWFDGDRFITNGRPIQQSEVPALIRHLCEKASMLPRWQGETNNSGDTFSVHDHSLLVAFLVYEGATKPWSGIDAADAGYYFIAGLVHDLGETLGLGDIASPWVRSDDHLRQSMHRHQMAINNLMMVDTKHRIIKDADRLAAAIERRVFFGDYSRDCEAPGVDDLAAKFFGSRGDVILHTRPTADRAEHTIVVTGNGGETLTVMEAVLRGKSINLTFQPLNLSLRTRPIVGRWIR